MSANERTDGQRRSRLHYLPRYTVGVVKRGCIKRSCSAVGPHRSLSQRCHNVPDPVSKHNPTASLPLARLTTAERHGLVHNSTSMVEAGRSKQSNFTARRLKRRNYAAATEPVKRTSANESLMETRASSKQAGSVAQSGCSAQKLKCKQTKGRTKRRSRSHYLSC